MVQIKTKEATMNSKKLNQDETYKMSITRRDRFYKLEKTDMKGNARLKSDIYFWKREKLKINCENWTLFAIEFGNTILSRHR
jgi:hypothetical protein